MLLLYNGIVLIHTEGAVHMLNIQDVSHLSEEEQTVYNRFVESVKQSNLPVRPCIKMELSEMQDETLLKSKIGGVPFLKSVDDIPLDENIEPMALLAQINLSELAEEQKVFPVNEGIIQFWISAQNEMYGLSDEKENDNPNSSLIYIKDPVTNLTFEDVRAHMDSLAFDKENIPFDGTFSIEYKLTEQTISSSDYRYDEDLRSIWNKVNPSFKLESMFDGYDDLMELVFNTFSAEEPSNQLGGYPLFMQADPRAYDKGLRVYDTLLLQIDSTKKGNAKIMWGDLGIGNIFIKPEDLLALKFDDYMYTWDCG